jgi:hypothetical protein
MTDPLPPAEPRQEAPPGTTTSPGAPPEGAPETLAGLNNDELRDLGRALATGEALAWVQAQAADEEGTPASREARYRTERNAAQAKLAAATARVQQLQRAEVERLAGAKLAAAGDLFHVGARSWPTS